MDSLRDHLIRRLQTSWVVGSECLELTYTVSNPEPHFDILTFDGASGDPGAGMPDLSEQLYVSFEAPDRVAVKRVAPPLPHDKEITAVRNPTCRRVGPGESRVVRFRLPLPLRERSEYFPHHPNARYELCRARGLSLWVGYVELTEGVRVAPVNADLGIFRICGSVRNQRYFVGSGPVDIQVLVRQDAVFERV